MDFQYMFEQLKEISHHNSPLGCNLSILSLRKEIRKGLISKFCFVCSFMSIGSVYAGLEEVSSSLAIPCMAECLFKM